MSRIYQRNGVWYGTADDMIARIEQLEARVAAADALAEACRDLGGMNVREIAAARAAYEATKEQSE